MKFICFYETENSRLYPFHKQLFSFYAQSDSLQIRFRHS